jgi:Dolichyl-phosphate-mannose-protein mannosyltransferase
MLVQVIWSIQLANFLSPFRKLISLPLLLRPFFHLSGLTMSSPQGSVRQRNVPKKSTLKDPLSGPVTPSETEFQDLVKSAKIAQGGGSQWDYRIALAIITGLAFLTRFWGIGHPDEVVFDEVHFGKVSLYLPLVRATMFIWSFYTSPGKLTNIFCVSVRFIRRLTIHSPTTLSH